jgi:hypothetical protein
MLSPISVKFCPAGESLACLQEMKSGVGNAGGASPVDHAGCTNEDQKPVRGDDRHAPLPAGNQAPCVPEKERSPCRRS